MSPKLHMLIGLPGSGKSTWMKNQKLSPSDIVLSTDAYIELKAMQEGKTYNATFKQYIKEAEAYLEERLSLAIKTDANIIWDQTNLNRKTRARKLSKIPKKYHKIGVVFSANPSIIDAVNEERKKIGRAIPEHVLESMYKSFEAPEKYEFDELIVVKRQNG